jgi:membrane protease subunit HflK
MTSLHQVGPQEQAIVSTFGAWGPAQGPGVALCWPWPIGAAKVEDVTTVRRLSLPEGEGEHLILTRDAGLVDLGYDVRWRISDLRRHAQGLADPDTVLRLAADTAMRATLAGMDFSAAMGGGRAGSEHGALGHEAARRLQALLDRYQAGIIIDGIDIRRVDPPARVADSLRAVAAARTEAATEAAQANSWAHQWIVHAQGEAGAFDQVYAQYRRAPDITRRQMYYATMERVLAQGDKVIVDAPGTTMTLPPLAAPGAEPPAAKAGDGH